jgi:hypothetical protein
LECLLGTDSVELTHKLSERIAWLLSDNAENRVRIFRQVKALYTIRSRVIHGSVVTKAQLQELSRHSEIADEFLRQLLNPGSCNRMSLLHGSPCYA